MAVQDRRIEFKEAGTAINRASLRRVERYGRRLAAFGAAYRDFDPLPHTRCLRRGNCRQPLIFCLFAVFAAFWWILQVLVAKESLLAGSPNESPGTINAHYFAICNFIFTRGNFGCIGRFANGHFNPSLLRFAFLLWMKEPISRYLRNFSSSAGAFSAKRKFAPREVFGVVGLRDFREAECDLFNSDPITIGQPCQATVYVLL